MTAKKTREFAIYDNAWLGHGNELSQQSTPHRIGLHHVAVRNVHIWVRVNIQKTAKYVFRRRKTSFAVFWDETRLSAAKRRFLLAKDVLINRVIIIVYCRDKKK